MTELPPLDEGVLDDAGLDALLRDISACTQLIEVQVKGGRQERAAGADLVAARAALRSGARGMQVRYRHDGVEWWDTVMRAPAGWRVVRIRHDGQQP